MSAAGSRRRRPAPLRRFAGAGVVLLAAAVACGGEELAEEAATDYTEPPAYATVPGGGAATEIRFTDITADAGIDFRHVTGAFGEKWMPETMGGGVAIFDYDTDGLPDLFFTNGTAWPGRGEGRGATAALYRNRGDGAFEDVTARAGLAEPLYGMAATAADYDADGDPDLYVTAVGDNRLYRNDGGRFTDVTRAMMAEGNPPGTDRHAWSTGAAWLDADGDGRLDLFVCNYVRWTPETDLFTTLDGVNKSYATPQQYDGESCRLLRNAGTRFEDVTAETGLENPAGKSLGVVVDDFDGDGRPDLAVSNDTYQNFLYLNRGDGRFEDAALRAGVAFDEFGRARAGMGIDAADIANQDRLSIAIGNFSNEAIALYTQIGDSLFQDLAGSARLTRPTLLPLTFGLRFADLDLDGYVDLLLGNGHIEPDIGTVQADVTFEQPPQLFRNDGRGGFVDVGAAVGGGFETPIVARGIATSDFDRDGDLDVVIATNGGPPRLLRNDLPHEGKTWIRIRLVGPGGNPDAVGATARVYAGGMVQRFFLSTSSSYLSQSEVNPLLVGLGGAAVADSVVVRWPGGGTGRALSVPAGSEITIRAEEGGAP